MDLYAQNILDHFKHPHNQGRLISPSVTRHEANHSCGDQLDVDLDIHADKITKIAFTGAGCAVSQAAMSILSDEVAGKSADAILNLTEQDIHKLLGVDITARRRKCALLSLLTVKNAVLQYLGRPELKWVDLVEE